MSIGFDTFREKYSIEEADTLDFSNEVLTSVGAAYRRGWGGANGVAVRDVVSLSNAALRNRWQVDLDLEPRRDDRLSVSSELTTRRIRGSAGADYDLSSDYVHEVARIGYRARLSELLALDLGDRAELIDFDRETAYEYDYRRNLVSAGLVIDQGLDGAVEAAYRLGHRAVPDSSAIDFVEHGFRAVWWRSIGLSTHLEVEGDVERRRYADQTARPGSDDFRGDGRLRVRAADRFEIRFSEAIEHTSYDIPGPVYFDHVLVRSAVEGAVTIGSEIEIGVEPRAAFLRADAGSGEDYDELSVACGADWMRLGRAWLNATLEVGRRDYLEEVPAGSLDRAAGIYSDYTFLRADLLATIDLGAGIAWNLFASYEPERHADETDDSTTALVSTDLTLRF